MKRYTRKPTDQGSPLKAVQLKHPKILVRKSGIFFGWCGDWLVSTWDNRFKWIVERDAFKRLYQEDTAV